MTTLERKCVIMLKKTMCLLALGLCMLTGCSGINEKGMDSKEKEKTLVITPEYDYAYDLSDNKALCKNHEYIALIEIAGVDGTSNYNDKLKEYVNIYTYGKAIVKSVYKGDLEKGEEISFTRLGGQLKYADWKKGLNERQLARLKNEDYSIVINKYDNDIDVELGKTYLVFLDHTSAQKENEYAITGFAYVMREVEEANMIYEESELRVKNNISGEYEPLSSVVDQDSE